MPKYRIRFIALVILAVLAASSTVSADIWRLEKGLTKHRISFEEASTVFFDENARLIHDPGHSAEEDRFVLLGLSCKLKLFVVCHCYRVKERIIRIISARKADKQEQKQYGRFL